MKKFLLLTLTIVVACATAMAADVDLATAQRSAQSFMSKQVANGRLKAAATSNLKLAKAEASVFNPKAVDYYIFNADKSYVVVAGDDQAPEILMYGEEGTIDLDNIPPAMQWLLNKYKYQIDGLKAGTMKANGYIPKATTAVAPMVTANWDQSAPYNNQCPTSGGRRALTGCPATSLAMCYYKWKWPTTFPACAAINGNTSGGFSVSAIGERAADWDNIIDEYTGPSNYSSTSAQKDAVAWLMRYAGQSIPDYMYGTSASGANDPEIYQGVLNMGYTDAQYLLLTELVQSGWSVTNGPQQYTDAQWNNYMMTELQAGRPIEYLAYDPNSGGHAFNVFGCNASGQYYVNWGWSGDSNGYCTLHNFTTATGSTGESGSYTFNWGEAMIIGIEPPASAFAPSIDIEVSSVTLTPGQTKVIPITGTNLTNNVTVTLTDPNNAFTLSVDGVNQTLNATPKSSGNITIPVASINDKTVNVRLTAKSGIEGEFNGSLSFASQGADTKTVSIKATSDDGGTASDAYLDIAKYATIDAAGWNKSLVNNLYKYTENASEEVAWLTLPMYGAFVGAKYSTTSTTFNSGSPQKWIETSVTASNQCGNTTWSATDVYQGSTSYFTSTTEKAVGTNSNSSTTEKSVTFYVKNITAVRLYASQRSNSNTYPTTLRVYACTVNGDGTLTPSSTATKSGSRTSSGAGSISLTGLDETTVYKVVASQARGYLYEIAFQTPLNKPTLAVNPEELYISAEPNSSATATFNVKGKLLENPVTVTLADANGVFSVSPTSISIANAEASTGTDVTVTFSPQNTGNFTGTVTLTSGTLSKTVTLNGTCAEKGTAHGNYLDIAKYATIDENDWYSAEYGDKPYEYTVYPSDGVAWLTMPAFMAYGAWVEDNQGWGGMNSDMSIWNGITWTASDVFKGSSDYFGSHTAYFMGSSNANTSTHTLAFQVFDVTNCTQAKAYCYNYTGTSTNYPAIMMISELTEEADGTLTESEEDVDYQTASSTGWSTLTSIELDPNKIYRVYVAGYHSFICEVGFRTPMEGLPGVPTIVSAEPTATTSEITWTEGENNESWNLRYREYLDPEDATVFFDDFENGLGNWTIYTDGTAPQTNGWYAFDPSTSDLGVVPVSGSYVASAWSWSTNAYNANNWLITPQVTFGKVLTFWVRTNNGWPDSYEVLLSTTGNAESNFNVTLQAMAEAPNNGQWNLVSIDLSDYVGQTGYIAIHHVSEDCNYLLIDDFGIYNELAGDWIEVNNVTSPYTITGLTPETTYEVQVQGVNDIAASAWTPSTIFTTLALESKTLAEIESEGKKGETYTISDELVAVYANPEMGILWCKDQGTSDQPISSLLPTYIKDGQIDYMKDFAGEQKRDWDQSNWVALKFPEATSTNTNSFLTAAVGKKIAAGTITGRYTDNENYTIEVLPNENNEYFTLSGDGGYTMNVYCTANFLETNLNLTAESQGAPGLYHGQPAFFFFMNPKIQEVCKITYAEWDGSKFVVPTEDDSQIPGAFNVDFSRNGQTPTLQVGKVYQFVATVVNRPRMSGMLKADPSSNIVVMPLNLTGGTENDVPTGINTVGMDNREVVAVEYVNSLGLTSKKPFQGMNIVVTRYSDGSKTTVKKIFK